MEIDLSLLHSNTVSEIDISGSYDIPYDYYENSNIIKPDKSIVDGVVRVEAVSCDVAQCSINGNMIIPDSISLEPVSYSFQIDYDDIISETSKKSENSLDIFQFLWENTVLEVPLQFTKVEDLSKFHGDGWKLISEDELRNASNPFSDLLKDYDKE